MVSSREAFPVTYIKRKIYIIDYTVGGIIDGIVDGIVAVIVAGI